MQEIYVIDDQSSKLAVEIREKFLENRKDDPLRVYRKFSEDIDKLLKEVPDMFVINEDGLEESVKELVSKIKNDENNTITPIIVISSNSSRMHRVDVMSKGTITYIRKPYEIGNIYYSIENILEILNVNRRVNPLTGLPGNTQIQSEMTRRLNNQEKFTMFYFDLDNFKSYNDKYGFSKGDEIIKYTAKSIVENFTESDEIKNVFIGHVGGDDFVAITAEAPIEELASKTLEYFDNNIKEYLTEEDYNRGYLEVPNRRGIVERFPITSLSAGIVEVFPGKFSGILEIGEAGAQVKKRAKQIEGSSYFIDRRI